VTASSREPDPLTHVPEYVPRGGGFVMGNVSRAIVRGAALVPLLAVLASCGSIVTSFSRRTAMDETPRDPSAIAVHTLQPERPYRVLAYVEARGDGPMTGASAADLIVALRREAAAHGCPALVVTRGFCHQHEAVYGAPLLAAGLQMEGMCVSFASP
jgi:hypothetical protein